MLNVRWEYDGAMHVQGQGQGQGQGRDFGDGIGDGDGDESDVHGGGVSERGERRERGERVRGRGRFVVPSREGVDEEFYYDVGGAGVGR